MYSTGFFQSNKKVKTPPSQVITRVIRASRPEPSATHPTEENINVPHPILWIPVRSLWLARLGMGMALLRSGSKWRLFPPEPSPSTDREVPLGRALSTQGRLQASSSFWDPTVLISSPPRPGPPPHHPPPHSAPPVHTLVLRTVGRIAPSLPPSCTSIYE